MCEFICLVAAGCLLLQFVDWFGCVVVVVFCDVLIVLFASIV